MAGLSDMAIAHAQDVHGEMEAIQMVDLKNQYLKIKPALDAAIQGCIDSTSFINGPTVRQFEQQLSTYLSVKHTVACANGTDALQIAMMAVDFKPGDEVILPAFNYVATAEVIRLLGLTPVLIDVDPDTFNIDSNQIEKAISARTKAIVPVHLFGQCADMEPVLSICADHNLFCIEDAAQAVGTTYRFSTGTTMAAGTMGVFGTTSFFPSKNLGCFGDGGALFSNDEFMAGKAKMIANHGQQTKYEHEVVGINSRLDSIQAAVLLEKIKHLPVYTQSRQRVAQQYDAAFKDIEQIKTPFRANNSTHVFHQYTLKVPAPDRDKLRNYLSHRNIPSMVYYPKPLFHQRAYQSVSQMVGTLPVATDLCERVLSLPMHTELSEGQVAYITKTVTDYFS